VRRSFLEGPLQFQSRKARETSIGTNELAILFNRERSKIGVRNIVAGRICFAAESDKDFPMTNACVYRSSHGRRAQRFDEIKRCECRRGCFENPPISSDPKKTRQCRIEETYRFITIECRLEPTSGHRMRGQIFAVSVHEDVDVR
jgi:hypothetical protein